MPDAPWITGLNLAMKRSPGAAFLSDGSTIHKYRQEAEFVMESQHEERPREPNTIYVGKKPTMAYVLACLTQIQNGGEGITVKARGKSISRAVDVAQILTKRFATDIKVKSISINTEQVKSTITGGMNNVSSIEIRLQK
jgi:DNA-binding protein